MVTDWYRKYRGHGIRRQQSALRCIRNTPGMITIAMPSMTNLVEIRGTWRKSCSRNGSPRHMWTTTGWALTAHAFSLPPYAEPVRPMADPLIWRELSWYGAHMAYKEEEEAKSGVFNMGEYSGWGHFGFHWITSFHNIAGMLTESAAAQLATPLYLHPRTTARRRAQHAEV